MESYDYTNEFQTIIDQQQTIIENQELLLKCQDTSLIYIVVIGILIASNMIHHLFDSVYKRK